MSHPDRVGRTQLSFASDLGLQIAPQITVFIEQITAHHVTLAGLAHELGCSGRMKKSRQKRGKTTPASR
jgi:hypothetical protein